jgi:hypothetical protein
MFITSHLLLRFVSNILLNEFLAFIKIFSLGIESTDEQKCGDWKPEKDKV